VLRTAHAHGLVESIVEDEVVYGAE